MNKWMILGSILLFLILIGIGASYFEPLPVGQVVATLASVTVAVVGLFLFFRKTKL
jgi:hypothetical protein